MVGNMIYLFYKQDLVRGGIQLVAPHATFDGAKKRFDEAREYWSEKGKIVYDDGVSLIVRGEDGTPLYYYFVSTRTIRE